MQQPVDYYGKILLLKLTFRDIFEYEFYLLGT
jgi:hypothetical protein